MAEEVGGIVYEVGMEVQGLKAGVAAAESELSKVDSAANSTNKSLDKLDNQASATGKAFSSLVSIVKNIDATLTKMSASSGQAGSAVQQASQSAEQANQVIAALNTQISLMQQQQAAAAQSSASLETSLNATTAAIRQMAQQTSASSQQISGADRMIEQLGNQVAILDEQMENGARSAAIFAAQLRAGDGATDAQKAKIAELTGHLYDMRNGLQGAAKGVGGFRTIMQQGGYQIQDFIVQVQGGQNALVAFSQQGSQFAGAFGPTGAIVGALIALGSVITGVLITSLNGGKNAMDALKDAAEAMDKVVTVSANGVAALSDKWAALARTNAEVATLMRNQALLEYNQAIAKIPKAISDAADSFVTLGDKAMAAIGGASPSIKKFNDELAALKITTDDWSSAIQQANSQGQYAAGITNSLSATVNTLASRLGISQQQAFELARQLSDLSKNPSPQALQELAEKLQQMKSSSTDGQAAISTLAGQIVTLAREAANAKVNVDALKSSTDNLTAGQQGLIKQSERNLALSKLEGAERAKLAAQYAAEDAGFSANDPRTTQLKNQAAATYENTEAARKLKKENDSAAKMAESNAQKLAKLKSESELAAESTTELSRAQAILNAQQSLNKGATQEDIRLAGEYAARKWDNANAIKAEAAARKLLPETAENAAYQQDMKDLQTSLDFKKISQQQYNATAERLAQEHQVKMAQISAKQTVTPMQEAQGSIDPVQQLANQHSQELALIQQFESKKGELTQQGLALMNAANTKYEQDRINAQWEIWRQQNIGTQTAAAAFDAFGQSASNAFTGILTGSMSAADALRSVGSTVLNDVVNTFVQMGVQWVKSSITGAAAQQAAIAATTAASVAGTATTTAASTSAAVATTAAWTPAAIVASIGSFGGAAAIGLAAVVAALAFSGKRKNGGPVRGGSMYEVGENGLPEIFQASNGSQYMIPGNNGRVISNNDLTSGSSSSGGLVVYNNVTNNSSASVSTSSTKNSDGSVTIETLITDLNEGGPLSQAITANTTASRRATE